MSNREYHLLTVVTDKCTHASMFEGEGCEQEANDAFMKCAEIKGRGLVGVFLHYFHANGSILTNMWVEEDDFTPNAP